MSDHEAPDIPLPPPADPGPRCPWCSAPVASADAVTCSACGATLHGDAEVDVPGVTAIDGQHVSHAAPRRVRRTLGTLFAGGDDTVASPSEAELPALALPDPDVRREMLRIRLDAELADLTARVEALAAERGMPMSGLPTPGVPEVEPEPDPAPEPEAEPGPAGERATGATPPGEDARP